MLNKRLETLLLPCPGNGYRPKFLESRFLVYCLFFLLLLKIITIPFLVYFSENVFFADIAKNAIVGSLNKDRLAVGLEPLKENPILEKAAYLKAKDMLEKDYFSHWSPEGTSPWHWLQTAGYQYSTAGENLAIGFVDSEEVYQAWLNSPSHKANMLGQNFQETGIAILRGDFEGNEVTVVVNFFGKPVRQAQGELVQQVQAQDQKEKESASVAPSQKNASQNAVPETEKTQTITTPEAMISIAPISSTDEEKKEIQEELVSDGVQPVAAAETALMENAGSLAVVDKKSASFNLINFIDRNYYNAVQKAIYVSLIIIIALLLINIFVEIKIQHFDLIMKTFGFGVILFIFYAIDKITLINLIPHNLRI